MDEDWNGGGQELVRLVRFPLKFLPERGADRGIENHPDKTAGYEITVRLSDSPFTMKADQLTVKEDDIRRSQRPENLPRPSMLV